jgi:hypothetical protein
MTLRDESILKHEAREKARNGRKPFANFVFFPGFRVSTPITTPPETPGPAVNQTGAPPGARLPAAGRRVVKPLPDPRRFDDP